MCSPAICQRCGKATWAGCGQHVDEVMSGIPQAQQCVCDSDPAPAGDGRSRSAEAGAERAR